MHLRLLSLIHLLFCFARTQEHGEGDEGTIMGPVAFLWPENRDWNASTDNTGPCGSPDTTAENRTIYPLSQGEVALSIADDAYKVAFRLAIGNNPTSQSDFDDQIVSNVTEIEPGHQCYKIDALENIVAGTNATIQLEYWADYPGENNGKNESFFACADITFVETKDFSLSVPCFNVTAEDFNSPSASSTASMTPSATGSLVASSSAASNAPSSTQTASSSGGRGLSAGAKAGIAVAAIVGVALIGALAFFLYRRGKTTGLQNRDEYELRAKKLGTGNEVASATSANI